MELEFLPCPTCREITMVEVPPCPDAHDADCPDRACTRCGTALVLDCAQSGDRSSGGSAADRTTRLAGSVA